MDARSRSKRSNVKSVALTQTPRSSYPHGRVPQTMGYSVRSKRYRYTKWRNFASGKVQARELYDHESDRSETINVVGQPRHAGDVARLGERLRDVLPRRVESANATGH